MQKLVIMQGPPGSGKTALAAAMAYPLKEDGVLCSTDDYSMTNGRYVFDPSKLAENHQKNQARVRHYLQLGMTAFVDNTNTQRWEAKPYVQMAVEMGIPVEFVRATGDYPNVHGVPPEKVAEMKARMEDLSVETCLQALAPWEVPAAGGFWAAWCDDSGDPGDNFEIDAADAAGLAEAIIALWRELGEEMVLNHEKVHGLAAKLKPGEQEEVEAGNGRLYFGRA